MKWILLLVVMALSGCSVEDKQYQIGDRIVSKEEYDAYPEKLRQEDIGRPKKNLIKEFMEEVER